MGKYRFERAEHVKGAKNIINFDSSPKFSICKQFGYAQDNFELRKDEKRSTDRKVVYDVFAGQVTGTDDSGKPVVSPAIKRGVMEETADEVLLERFG